MLFCIKIQWSVLHFEWMDLLSMCDIVIPSLVIWKTLVQ